MRLLILIRPLVKSTDKKTHNTRLDFKHVGVYALRCFKFQKSVYISSNDVLRMVFSCFANSQDFNHLCYSYGVSVMRINFSELTCVVYEHFMTSTV